MAILIQLPTTIGVFGLYWPFILVVGAAGQHAKGRWWMTPPAFNSSRFAPLLSFLLLLFWSKCWTLLLF
jgi:hypothetical protein